MTENKYFREVISNGRITIPADIREAQYYEISKEMLDGEEVIVLREAKLQTN